MKLKNLESRTFLALVLLVSVVFLWMVRGFLMPVFWAAVLAVLFRPVYRWYLGRLKGRPSAAAALTTLTVVLVVLIPLGLLGMAVTQQALGVYQSIRTGELDLHAPVDYAERSLPAISRMLSEYGVDANRIRTSVQTGAAQLAQFLANQAVLLGQNTVTFVVMFFLMLYFLFFFVRDGDRLREAAIRAMPLGDARERRLFALFAEVSRATMKGTLVVAAVQGAIGGILFAIVGIGAPAFWGAVMVVASLLPTFGAALVWAPAAIYLLATGAIWQGVVLILGGTFLIGLVDNFLRPILVGRDTQMPDYFVLLASLGGLAMFGLAGLVIGPVVGALFLVLWEMFAEENQGLDSSAAVAVSTHPPDPAPALPPAPPPAAD